MKKIRVMRQSKLPVKLENLSEFKKEWKDRYDELYDAHEAQYGKNVEKLPILAQKLEELESEMMVKYPTIEEWDWVNTKSNWKKLISDYGPIGVATAADNPNEIVYVILDQL